MYWETNTSLVGDSHSQNSNADRKTDTLKSHKSPSHRSSVWVLSHFSRVWLFVTLWTVVHQASLSLGFCKQEYHSGLPCSPPGNLPDPGIEPTSLTSPALAGEFFTTSITWETLPVRAPHSSDQDRRPVSDGDLRNRSIHFFEHLACSIGRQNGWIHISLQLYTNGYCANNKWPLYIQTGLLWPDVSLIIPHYSGVSLCLHTSQALSLINRPPLIQVEDLPKAGVVRLHPFTGLLVGTSCIGEAAIQWLIMKAPAVFRVSPSSHLLAKWPYKKSLVSVSSSVQWIIIASSTHTAREISCQVLRIILPWWTRSLTLGIFICYY